MIGKLKGQIDEVFDDHAIIDVSGVGYLVYSSAKTLHKLVKGEFCQLFIETHVREDHIHLYGFLSSEEKKFFNILQSVSGVGTRMALAILSHMAPRDIQIALSSKDKEAFKAVSGVGPKLAERIIVELKDKVAKNIASLLPGSIEVRAAFAPKALDNDNKITNAISALTNLGVNRSEAYLAVTNIVSQDENIAIDELIKLALKTRV